MHLGFGVAAVVVASLVFAFALLVIVPVAIVYAGVRLASALFSAGAAPFSAPRDAARDVGWAVGLLVAGALWMLGRFHFAALLLGVGAGLLARGLLASRRPPA